MLHRKLKTEELNRISAEQFKEAQKSGLVIMLDNVRSLHNIGAVFRTADAYRADCIYLCGICATPPNAEIHKTALGAELSVDYKYFKNSIDAVNDLKANGYKIIAIEQTENSVSLENYEIKKGEKYAVILGHEVKGVQQEVVDAADYAIELPQFGTKHSLNVSVTAGIVIWEFAKHLIMK